MTRKTNQLADKMLEATSRRGFLGRTAKLAASAAAMLASALAAVPARAAKPEKTAICCWYVREDFLEFTKCFRGRKTCPEEHHGATLEMQWDVSDCSLCDIRPPY